MDNCCSDCDSCDSLGVAIGETGATGATGSTGATGAAGAGWLYGKIVVPSASILTGNATPITLVAAPGGGYALELISAFPSIDTYGGAAYATNTTLQIITNGATTAQAEDAQIMLSTVARKGKFALLTTTGTTDTQIIENQALNLKVKTGNPTAGNSAITIYFVYRVVTL